MKKILFIAFLAFFGFNMQEVSAFNEPDCVGVALGVFDAYYNNGYSYEEAYQASNWAYEGCTANLGYPGEEVILR